MGFCSMSNSMAKWPQQVASAQTATDNDYSHLTLVTAASTATTTVTETTAVANTMPGGQITTFYPASPVLLSCSPYPLTNTMFGPDGIDPAQYIKQLEQEVGELEMKLTFMEEDVGKP